MDTAKVQAKPSSPQAKGGCEVSPRDGRGLLRRKSSMSSTDTSTKRQSETNSQASPTKIHPVTAESINLTPLEKKGSKYTKQRATAALQRHHGAPHVVLQGVISATLMACLGWTLWLVFLNIAPNETVNRVMDTKTFDYGSFWLMVDPPGALVVVATLGLSIVATGYLCVIVKLLSCKRNAKRAYLVPQADVDFMKKVEKALDEAANKPRKGKALSAIVKLAADLSHEGSSTRKVTKLLMKFGDLALETVLLYQMLESGSPTVLIAIFTVIVASNAISCAVMMFVPYERAPMAEFLIDIMFDWFIAIGYPMLVVAYCLSTFTFDRAKFAINLEVFPIGYFEQGASVIADPVQTAVIYRSLRSLRIMSVLDFFTRMGVNFTLCFRLRYIVELTQNPRKQQGSVYPKRHRVGAAILVIFAALLVVFVEESMRTSTLACQPHPECVVHARRWTAMKSDSLTQCPCLIMIDRDIAPKTYGEWENPKNVTEKVIQLATTGELQTLQLTNRYLPVLPEELRRCTNLKHLSLEYTHIQTLPAWAKEFTRLEFLHVESKFSSPVVALPDDLFDDMSSLTFIHFAAFIPMTKMPSFDGLTNLKSLTLAVFLALEEIPALDSLGNLERLVLSSMPAMNSLPDFAPLKNLNTFFVSDRGAWCCNGFLGICDLSDGKCGVHPLWGSPAATCLPPNQGEKIASAATLSATAKFASTICGPVLQPGALEGPPTPDIMDPCNGTMYRQCETPDNVESMCYNARFMAIACTTSKYPIEMRRRQIAQNVGDRCDPVIEAWLGCK